MGIIDYEAMLKIWREIGSRINKHIRLGDSGEAWPYKQQKLIMF